MQIILLQIIKSLLDRTSCHLWLYTVKTVGRGCCPLPPTVFKNFIATLLLYLHDYELELLISCVECLQRQESVAWQNVVHVELHNKQCWPWSAPLKRILIVCIALSLSFKIHHILEILRSVKHYKSAWFDQQHVYWVLAIFLMTFNFYVIR